MPELFSAQRLDPCVELPQYNGAVPGDAGYPAVCGGNKPGAVLFHGAALGTDGNSRGYCCVAGADIVLV